jgi:hypothetical protein
MAKLCQRDSRRIVTATKHDRAQMSDFAIIEDKCGRRHHFTVNMANPVSQVLDSLADHLTTDKSLLELSYLGNRVRHDQTFSDIGYTRLSSLAVTCPIDRVSGDRSAQIDFLEREGITPVISNQLLDQSQGDLRSAMTYARFGMDPSEPHPPPPPAPIAPSEQPNAPSGPAETPPESGPRLERVAAELARLRERARHAEEHGRQLEELRIESERIRNRRPRGSSERASPGGCEVF